MGDLIDRQAAITQLSHNKNKGDDEWKLAVENDIQTVWQLPPIQPKRGKWISADAIFGGVPFYCSECGENTRDTVMGEPRWNFCPNCGAKMEVNSESN